MMETFSADLTLDELRFVAECFPDLALPPILQLGSFEESSSDDIPSVEDRRTAVQDSLTDRALIATDTAQSSEDTADDTSPATPWQLNPLLRSALVFPLVAQSAIRVKSWIPKTSSQTLVAVSGSIAATMTVTLSRDRGADTTDPRTQTVGQLSIRLGPLSSVTDALIALIDEAPAEPKDLRPGSRRVGLVASRSIIEAIRQGDDLVVARLAEQFDAVDAVGVLRTLAATMETGFHLQVSVRPGRIVHEVEWVQSSKNEWVTMRIVVPGNPTTVNAEVLTDDGQVEILSGSRSMIVNEILSVLSSIAESTAHAAAAEKDANRGN